MEFIYSGVGGGRVAMVEYRSELSVKKLLDYIRTRDIIANGEPLLVEVCGYCFGSMDY